MPFSLDLRLEERRDDRVFVTVILCPGAATADVDGVAITLVGPTGDALSSRLMLPISGQLTGMTRSTVELRAAAPLPDGCRVLAEAWSADTQHEFSCPAEPSTNLEGHVRGRSCVTLARRCRLSPIAEAERAALARALPWLRAPCPTTPKHVDAASLSGRSDADEHVSNRESSNADLLSEVEAFCRAYDLDAEDQAMLEELMTEEVDR